MIICDRCGGKGRVKRIGIIRAGVERGTWDDTPDLKEIEGDYCHDCRVELTLLLREFREPRPQVGRP